MSDVQETVLIHSYHLCPGCEASNLSTMAQTSLSPSTCLQLFRRAETLLSVGFPPQERRNLCSVSCLCPEVFFCSDIHETSRENSKQMPKPPAQLGLFIVEEQQLHFDHLQPFLFFGWSPTARGHRWVEGYRLTSITFRHCWLFTTTD